MNALVAIGICILAGIVWLIGEGQEAMINHKKKMESMDSEDYRL